MATTVLILSDKNETRSLILEGWLKYYAKSDAEIKSAGLESGKLNLIAAKAMMEAVIDITKYKSKALDSIENDQFDHIITLTEEAHKLTLNKFPKAQIHHKPTIHPLNEKDEDMEKLKKHRKTVNELEEYAMEFTHKHIRKLI
ncbi:MAG TPA: hypothetical protein VJ937_02910 [Salinivirga sp.]|uniref:arsenate reductase/protein-tyrosine-phosphatase family protein n=1 Tax=Salinivirga sp. TaxID=1970192 RepID=UPI002B48878E|nr:hypothetical protein [Salinivirga sp.]HKK58401.1 hypothetical protein [Salinivirga sp.]